MKKSNSATYLLLPIVYCLGLIPLVRAGPAEGVEQLLTGLTDVIGIIFRFALDTILEINTVDEFLFAKIIFLILIYLVIYVTVKKNKFFGDNDTIYKIITAAISILAVRFIPDDLIQVIFLQYSALGAALGMTIPFIIILFFLHESDFGPLPRKIGWIFYGISYIAIFSYTYTDLTGVAGYIYWSGIIAIIIAFFMDRQIHGAFGSIKIQESKRKYSSARYTDIVSKRDKLQKEIDNGKLPENIVKHNQHIIETWNKELKKISKTL